MRAIKLRNREAVAFSASAATTGGHQSLSHVPGAALWGVTASAVYANAESGADTFTAAQSGALRISTGFPLTRRGLPAFPMPQSLREPKHTGGGLEPTEEPGEMRLTEAVWNLADPGGARCTTPGEALKGRYLAADGTVLRPPKHERGKTAIKEGERVAAPAQYFQYEHLEAGQDWLAWIDGPGDLVEAAEAALAGGRPLRLGRSGLKELGGQFDVGTVDFIDPRTPQWSQAAEDRLVLWCLSDVALVDRWGQPDITPKPEALLPQGFAGRLDPAHSSIAVRRYAPYNAYLRAFDREHAVIEAGSVLVYTEVKRLDLSRFQEGIGLWRERGLGLVWPNPPLLMTARLATAMAPVKEGPSSRAAVAPLGWTDPAWADGDQTLLAVLGSRATAHAADRKLDEEVGQLLKQFTAQLENARRRGEITPGPAQWSQLARKAEERGMDFPKFRVALFDEARGLCVGARNPEWRPLAPFLQELVGKPGEPEPPKPPSLPALARVAWRLRQTWKATA